MQVANFQAIRPMVNGVSRKSLSKKYKVKVVNFPSETSDKILDHLEKIIREKPDDVIVHVGTNNLMLTY